MSNPDDPAQWIVKAENDLLNIRNNLAANQIPWDTLCFHAQQSAEKLLKAFLISRGGSVARTHDLIALLAQAVDLEPSLKSLEQDCRLLNPFAVLVRYPGSGPMPTERESRQAIDAAQRLQIALVRVIQPPSTASDQP